MRFKASYFNLSGALIGENIRRFWALSVLSFIGYFLAGILPIIFSYSRLDGMSWQIQQLLNNQYFPYGFLHLVVPVVAAVILYRYLHSPGSVTMVHGLPLTRAKIFNSNFLSGIILIVLPLIVTTLILLLLVKPVFAYGGTEDLFTITLVLQWFWQSLIVVTSVYGIGVFAGVVSGNTALHMLLGFGFNGLLPALYSVSLAYFNEFLFGFDGISRWFDLAAGIMPYTKAIQIQGSFSLGLTIYYIAFFLVVLVTSSFLYHKRQLEKAGDSLVFKSAGIVICYLIAFFGMSLMAFYFNTIPLIQEMESQGHMMFYFGLLVGIVIFLYIGRMIVSKTPRVFNRESLKHLVVYTLVALLFVLAIDFDFTGFEKRLPKISKVESASLTDLEFSDDYMRYDPVFFKGFENEETNRAEFIFADPENIIALTNFHQGLLDNRTELEKNEKYWSSQSLAIKYDGSGIFDMARRYLVPRSIISDSKDLKEIFESGEFKTKYSFKSLAVLEPTWIRVYNELLRNSTVDSYGVKTINNAKDIESLIAAMEEDFQKRTWEQHMDTKAPLASMELAFSGIASPIDERYGHYSDSYYEEENGIKTRIMPLVIRSSDTNTITWLKAQGYFEGLRIKGEDISYITVYHENQDFYENEAWTEDTYIYQEKYGVDWMDRFPKVIIDKPEDIQMLLDSYITSGINYGDTYYGVITFRKTAPFASSLYNYQNGMQGGEDPLKGGITADYNIYFDSENLPPLLEKAFRSAK
ncbi:MAG: hypothetical protein RBS51_06105 [Anaerovoracaceae bacterium]|jgi:ABC-2 type transport system permease protein|nr:hypothetical protein [Anaerovoracaceae bacterium]